MHTKCTASCLCSFSVYKKKGGGEQDGEKNKI